MDIREDLNIYMQIIRLLDESVNGYLYACDLQDDRMYFTDKICRRFALPFSGEQGIPFKEWEAVIYDRDVKLIKDDMEAVRSGKRNGCDIECRMIDREGNRVGVHWRATVHADKSGKPAVLLGSMDELVLGQRIDSLTGLWNYDKCTEDLESAVLKEKGYFIVFGIDNFKHINVKNGRPFGNDVLKRMTESLEKNADCSVTLYRLDGDCFAATLPGKGKYSPFTIPSGRRWKKSALYQRELPLIPLTGAWMAGPYTSLRKMPLTGQKKREKICLFSSLPKIIRKNWIRLSFWMSLSQLLIRAAGDFISVISPRLTVKTTDCTEPKRCFAMNQENAGW